MDRLDEAELMESMLDAAASMDILSDELDKISLQSFAGSDSRESSHSNSKFTDSAIDSHYSEDSNSIHSLSEQAKIQFHTAAAPPPPLASYYHQQQSRHQTTRDQIPTAHSQKSSFKKVPPQSNNSRHFADTSMQVSRSNVSPMQPEVLYISPTEPLPLVSVTDAKNNTTPPVKDIPSPSQQFNQDINISDTEYADLSGSGSSTPILQSSLSSISINSDSSGGNTPIIRRKRDVFFVDDPQPVVQRPLTPRVTILHPAEAKSNVSIDVKSSPRQPHVPKKGTVFYQDSLTPPHSPHLRAYREKKFESDNREPENSPLVTKRKMPAHSPLATKRKVSAHSPLATRRNVPAHSPIATRRNVPRRNPSILQRLIRKRGSFKQEGLVKKRLPVKRSLSNRITYHIKKGWVDYEEDLNFISQPSQPRAVGRMVDKKAGRYHMVQLFRPAGGRYGIYISETTGKKGVYISRFADDTAAKFYNGLISPGDQIVRVNGKNITETHSVDDVYDLMTASDSVIFTVIPISMRADW